MNTMTKILTLHPSELLRNLMVDHGISEAQLADRTGLSRALISQILRDNRRVTTTTAMILSRFFGNRPEDWIEAQGRYDIQLETPVLKKRLCEIVPITGNKL
jgi:antitoxin HigA-1